jgi:hypothetical protein
LLGGLGQDICPFAVAMSPHLAPRSTPTVSVRRSRSAMRFAEPGSAKCSTSLLCQSECDASWPICRSADEP